MARITKTVGLLTVLALMASACGTGATLAPPDTGANDGDPLIQIGSEGGFVPVEYNLSRGPTFTVTYGGMFVFPGVTTAEFPGRLIPAVFEAQLDESQMSEIRGILNDMGISEITDGQDNSVVNVADASTEVIRYWDTDGVHRYSVYALGITDQPKSDATAAFAELFDYLHELAGSVTGTVYEPDYVRVVAGVYRGGFDPEFEDRRDWPLEGENPDEWDVFTTIGEETWTCKVFDASVLSIFEDARQTTVWAHPTESGDAENFQLLVRPLHPGEEACSI